MHNNPSLIQLLVEKEELWTQVLSSQGEITPELEGLIQNKEITIENKIDRIARFLEKIPLEIAYLKSKAQEYKDAQKRLEGFEERLHEYFISVLQAHNQPLVGAESELTLARNPKRLEVTLTEEEIKKLAEENCPFVKTKIEYSLDKKAIVEAFKNESPITLYGNIVQDMRLKVRPSRHFLTYKKEES